MPLKKLYRRLDNSYFRSVYLGLLYEFTQHVFLPGYEQEEPFDEMQPSVVELEREYNERGRIFVPFFLSMGYMGERFGQDAFLLNTLPQEHVLCSHEYAEGDYERIPRGLIIPESISIDSGAKTNPFVRGKYYEYDIEKEEYREMNSLIKSLPMKMPCNCQILVDNQNDAWLIMQIVISLYHRVRHFGYTWKGIRGEGQFTLQPSSIDRLFEFSYPEANRILVNFALDVSVIMPIYDPSKKFDKSNVINKPKIMLDLDGIPPERIPTNPEVVGSSLNNLMK